MRIVAVLIFAALLCSCTGPEHVSADEFKKQYAEVGMLQTMRDVTYLGQRDGKAFIRVRAMSSVSKAWSDRIIYVEVSELDSVFREALPKTDMKSAK